MRPGLHDFSDIARFADQLDHQIYGIESGNDGNSHVLGIIQRERLRPGQLQAGRVERDRACSRRWSAPTDERRPIVFLGWDPHPMNMRFDLRYLTGR